MMQVSADQSTRSGAWCSSCSEVVRLQGCVQPVTAPTQIALIPGPFVARFGDRPPVILVDTFKRHANAVVMRLPLLLDRQAAHRRCFQATIALHSDGCTSR